MIVRAICDALVVSGDLCHGLVSCSFSDRLDAAGFHSRKALLEASSLAVGIVASAFGGCDHNMVFEAREVQAVLANNLVPDCMPLQVYLLSPTSLKDVPSFFLGKRSSIHPAIRQEAAKHPQQRFRQ